MATKLLMATLRPSLRPWANVKMLVTPRRYLLVPLKTPHVPTIRQIGHLIPDTQYDTPWPSKMKFGNVVTKNWEILPLFFVTGAAMSIMFWSIYWAINNKVDVVFRPRSTMNISRTMDLNHPTYHKMYIISGADQSWPEVANLLHRMKVADCKLKVDVSLGTHNDRDNISRTMDLDHPEAHKMFLMKEKYDKPWPSMARVLRKMDCADKKAARKKKVKENIPKFDNGVTPAK